MADLNDLIEDSNAKLSRRNVVVGTAWAVPAILAVGAAPAFAVSRVLGATAKPQGTSGGARKTIEFSITTSGAKTDDTVTVTSITPVSGAPVLNTDAPQSAGVYESNSATILIHSSTNPNSPAQSYLVNYTVTGISGSQSVNLLY